LDFINKSAYVFKNKYLGLAIEFISNILLVGYLGSENYGHYTVLYIIPILVISLGSFGFGPSIVYHINKIEFNLSQYLGTFTFLGLALGFIYFFVIMFFLTFIDEAIYNNKLNTDLFFISLLFIPIMITQKYLRAIVRGMYNIKLFSLLLDIIAPILRLIFITIIIYANLGLEGVCYIPIITQSIITFYIFVYLFKISEINFNNLFINKISFIIISKFAFKNYLGSALQKSNETLIILISSSLLTFKEVGCLNLAMKLLQIIAGFSNSIITVLMPKVSKSSIKQLNSSIPKVTSILFFFNFIAIVLYLYCLEYFVKLVYGNDFIEVVGFSVPLAVVTMFLPFANILLLAITFTGDPLKKLYARGLGLIVNLVLVYPLFIIYGSIGFVISIALGQFIIFLSSLLFFKNKFREIEFYRLFIIRLNDIKYLYRTLKKQLPI